MASLLRTPLFIFFFVAVQSFLTPKLSHESYILNLQYDHCQKPMKFSWQSLTCECPEPLAMVNGECVCENCVYFLDEERFVERNSSTLPEYMTDTLKEFDSEMYAEQGGHRQKRHIAKKLRRRKKILLLTPPVRRTMNVDLSSQPKDLKKKMHKLKHKKVPMATFSEGVIAGQTEGEAAKGSDYAKGEITSSSGTGAMSLATGGGSGGSAAITGSGGTKINAKSRGASVHGHTIISKDADEATATSAVLIGKGDVIAENVLGERGSASATAVATQQSAAAGGAAYGLASVSSSATPKGREAAGFAFIANGTLETQAYVQGDGHAIAETAAVGNPTQDIKQLKSSLEKNKSFFRETVQQEKNDWLDFGNGDADVDIVAPRIFSMVHHSDDVGLKYYHKKKG